MEWTERDVKTWKRAEKGGVYYVVVPGEAKYRSSGETKKPKAIAWALTKAAGGYQSDITLGQYAANFFEPGLCPIIAMREATGGANTLKHWSDQRAALVHHILPRWGNTMLAAIEAKDVFKWLSSPSLIRSEPSGDDRREWKKVPLSGAHRNRILIVFRAVMAHAVFDRIVPVNTLLSVPRMRLDSAPRGTFTDEELEKLFPMDDDELKRIWRSHTWAALYLVLADTGLRPSEALALRWKDWHPSSHAFVVAEKIDNKGKPGPLKTAKKGVAKRVALVNGRTAELLDDLMEARPRAEDGSDDLAALIFPATKFKRDLNDPKRRDQHQPMRVAVAGNHFVDCLARAGVEASGRTLYCLRHTANTGFRTTLGDDAARLLMGHTNAKMTEHYDHPEDAELVARALKAAGR